VSNEESIVRIDGAGTFDGRRAAAYAAMLALGLGTLGQEPNIINAASPDEVGAEGQSGRRARKVVREAKKHKGARYVSGGASPRGFDCSGFVWYVYNEVTGKDLGRTVKSQWKHGRKVKRRRLRPGDIVFFEDTFEKGLSHCGIYLKRQKFIHAENEQTGVVISRLDSDYYDKHYKGARRIL
jgi:cell wall-associated NlpC family hydrolase